MPLAIVCKVALKANETCTMDANHILTILWIYFSLTNSYNKALSNAIASSTLINARKPSTSSLLLSPLDFFKMQTLMIEKLSKSSLWLGLPFICISMYAIWKETEKHDYVNVYITIPISVHKLLDWDGIITWSIWNFSTFSVRVSSFKGELCFASFLSSLASALAAALFPAGGASRYSFGGFVEMIILLFKDSGEGNSLQGSSVCG